MRRRRLPADDVHAVVVALAVLVVLIGSWLLIGAQASCQRDGGTYVRTLVWFECVGGTR